MKILGISGSPVDNSNTDRTLLALLEASGLEYEMVKLVDYRVEPCHACLACVDSNSCVLPDDGNKLMEKVLEADALVVAGWTPYSSLDARTKGFLERLYPLRHKKGLLRGKPAAAIITSAADEDSASLYHAAEAGVSAIRSFMLMEGMTYLGDVRVVGNMPCIKCANVDTCSMSGIKVLHGPEATLDSIKIQKVEDQALCMDDARRLGRALAAQLNHH